MDHPIDRSDDASADTVEVGAVSGPQSLVERVRSASFDTARRGYDRRQVDSFLNQLAGRLELESAGGGPEALKQRLEKVGESTAGILTAAEASARVLREEAVAEAAELKRSAAEWADRVRQEAGEYAEAAREKATEEARRLRMETTEKAERALHVAEAQAEELLESSLQQRRVLEASVTRLRERRDAVLERIQALAQELDAVADEAGEPEEDFGFDDAFEEGQARPGMGDDELVHPEGDGDENPDGPGDEPAPEPEGALADDPEDDELPGRRPWR